MKDLKQLCLACGVILLCTLCAEWGHAKCGGLAVRGEFGNLHAVKGDTVQATAGGGLAEEAWREVVVTRKEKDVKGMRHLEDFDVTLSAPKGSRRAKAGDLEAGAIVQLQKRAVEKRATHLYIKEVKFMTAYGEPPSIRVVAQSYRKLKM